MQIDQLMYDFEKYKNNEYEMNNQLDEIEKMLKTIEYHTEEFHNAFNQSDENLHNVSNGLRGEKFERFFYQSLEENQSNKQRYLQALLEQEDNLLMHKRKVAMQLEEIHEKTGTTTRNEGGGDLWD